LYNLEQLQQRRLRGKNRQINNNLVILGGDGFSSPYSERGRAERCFGASHIPRELTTPGHSWAGYGGAEGREMFRFNFSEEAEVLTSTGEFASFYLKNGEVCLIADRLPSIATFGAPAHALSSCTSPLVA